LLRKAEGGLSTCCEINHFEKRCENPKDLRENAPSLRHVHEAHKRRGEIEDRVLEGEMEGARYLVADAEWVFFLCLVCVVDEGGEMSTPVMRAAALG
jgi:hypothetical protein